MLMLQGTSSQAVAAQMEQSLPPANGKLVGKSRMKREREAQIARGPAPEPCRDFRLPQHQIPALLMVWEFTQVSTLDDPCMLFEASDVCPVVSRIL